MPAPATRKLIRFEKERSAMVTRPTYYVTFDGRRVGYMFKDRATSLWCLRDNQGEWAQEDTLDCAKIAFRQRLTTAAALLGLET